MLQGLFHMIVREDWSEIRRMTNYFKALEMNMDELVVIVSFRWKSPSGAFIRLSECFILIVPKVDFILSIGPPWLHLERCNQAAYSTLAWKTGGTLTNSSPPSLLSLGLYTQNRYWLWRSRTGTGSLNVVKCRFVIVSESSSLLSSMFGSSTYSKLSSTSILTNMCWMGSSLEGA